MPTSVRFQKILFLVAVTFSVAASSVAQAGGQPATARISDADWKVEIIPAASESPIRAAVSGDSVGLANVPSDESPVPAASGPTYPRMTYAEAYNSISFSRAEYEANPSYRHEAAMELMLGAPRPTTYVRQTAPYFSRYPDFIRNRFQIYPYPPSVPQSMNVNLNYTTSVMAY